MDKPQVFVADGGIDEFPDPMDGVVFMDSAGNEVPNPEPILIYLPSGPVTEFDRVREIIRRELSIQAAAREQETMEEANDFDVDGDMFPVSPHEYSEDTEKADLEALAAHESGRLDGGGPPPNADDVGRSAGPSSRPGAVAGAPMDESTSAPPVQGGAAT